MQLNCSMNLWIKPEDAAAFAADPSANAHSIYFVPVIYDWPRHHNYILLGQQVISMPLDAQVVRQAAVIELDKKINDVRARMTEQITNLAAARESLLAIAYEAQA